VSGQLVVRNLNVRNAYTHSPLVSNLNFEIPVGRTLGIVGESGSGKTLTAMSVAGLLPPTVTATGIVELDGKALSIENPETTRDLRTTLIGVIFQNPSTALNPRLTVGAQLAEALSPEIRRVPRRTAQRCLDLLDEVGMREARQKLIAYPHELSGGLAQRAVIAMALARSPKLLIADEPTTALDVTIQAQILDLVATLQSQHGFGVMLITHDMGVIRDRADNVLVLAAGRSVEQGSAKKLFEAPASKEAKVLLRASEIVFASKVQPADELAAPLVAVRNVTKRFSNRHQALAGVSLTVKSGQSIGVVGESGSGKTTLARIIIGLESNDGGVVEVDGIARVPRTRSPRIQYVFQDPYASLDPRIMIIDSVAEPLMAQGDSRLRAREKSETLLTEVGLHSALWYKPPTELSGGQRQRVGIARAIAPNPKLLIADEPVAALDVTVREHILSLLEELRERRKMAQIMISHDLSVVARFCDEVIVMKDGSIVETGPIRQIFEDPKHIYTRELLSAVPGRRQIKVQEAYRV
jgi:peptide/nickel transport system ATP-binding protein